MLQMQKDRTCHQGLQIRAKNKELKCSKRARHRKQIQETRFWKQF